MDFESKNFSVMPNEKERDENGELSKKIEDANKKLKEYQGNTEKEAIKFDDPKKEKIIIDIINEYEEKLGDEFSDKKDKVLEELAKFANSKSGVKLDNFIENDMFKKALRDKLDIAVNQ